MNWLSKFVQLIGLEKGLIFVTAGNTIASLAGALFWLFLASILLVEDYGRLNYHLSLAYFLSVLSLLGLNTTVTTFLAKGNESLKYQANLLVLISNCFVVFSLLFLIKEISTVLLLIGISFYTMSWAEILGRKDYKKYSLVLILQRSLQILLSLFLYFIIGLDGLIIGYALSVLLLSYNFFKSFKGFKLTFKELRQKSSFIMHSYSQTISITLTTYLDKLLVAPLFGFGILGLYQISFQFLLFLSIIPLSLFQFLLPREASQKKDRKYTILGLIVAAISSTSFFIAIPTIIKTFFPHFIESILASQIMIFSVIPMTANSILISKSFGREKSKPILIAAGIYIFILLVLIVALGNILGLIGLAFSVVISSTAQTIALFFLSKWLFLTR
jgi:O-antigen/teichoic acid export membrane protein